MATVATEVPEIEWLQHVSGLRSGDDEAVFELATWYAELGAWPRYEVPVDAEDDLLHTLLAVEAKPTGALAVLAAAADTLTPGPAAAGVVVRAVAPGSDDVGTFATTVLDGHEVPDGGAADHVAAVAGWVGEPGWLAFVAELDGEVVGAAALTMADAVGYLANAATTPAARGHGVHAALIGARVAAARDAGCDLVCAVAEPDGASARNLVRAGLQVAGARTYWTCSP